MNKTTTFKASILTPIGYICIETSEFFLLSITFNDNPIQEDKKAPSILKDSVKQLEEYFSGKRKIFTIPLELTGTEFQKKVWKTVNEIEYGKTTNYLAIAKKLGSALKTRAVGMANSKNPIPIIIPCHRIIGSNGKLTGYAGGIERKRWLLQHELSHTQKYNQLF